MKTHKVEIQHFYYTFSKATIINKNTSNTLSPCWEEWPEKNWDCCLATTEIHQDSGHWCSIWHWALCTIRVCVWVSRCIQTSFIRQLGISDCGGLLYVTKIEMLNFGENPLADRTFSTHCLLSRSYTKQKGSNFFMTVLFLKGRKEKKYMNRKRNPVQTVQKKEGLKSGKVPNHKKNRL